MYKISPYAYEMAKKIGVVIKPSTRENKKIDVYKNNQKIASIGSLGMNDYQIYLKTHGKEFADERRRLYHLRHPLNTLTEKLSKQLLW
jgi:hypothetical protein